MAEAVVSIALQTLRDLLIEKGKFLLAVAGEVNALQTQLKEIKCFLEVIAEIRDLAYLSEDVVAEYSVRISSSSSSDGWGRRLLHRFSGVRHSSSLYQLRSEMLLIKSELARITDAMEGYGINRIIDGAAVSGDNQNLARKGFPNFEIGECFVGKEEDLKRLVSLVVDDKELRVISVWLMGGIGKTSISEYGRRIGITQEERISSRLHIPADFQLDEIGKEMVKKCGYLQAISLFGGVLSKRKSMAELMSVKENVSAYLYRGDGNIEGENEMHAVLNLSYEDLPYYLKPCFLYLGIFKEDEKVEAHKLYERWIAQVMVSDEMIRGVETLVDITELYLGELASRCMIKVEDNCDNISPKYWKCKLHDVVREFSQSTGKKEEFGVEVLEYQDGNFGSSLPVVWWSINKTRHLAIHFEGEVQGGVDLTITTRERLRSLEIIKKWNLKRIQFPLESMIDFEKFKVLRELLIQNFSFEGRKLPREITKLVHLQYFSLQNCNHLDRLLSSIYNLVYLVTLDLFGSRILQVPNIFKKMWRFKHTILPLYNDASTIGDYQLRLDEGVDELETLQMFDSRVHELKSTVRMKNLRRFEGQIFDNKSLSIIVNAMREHCNKLQYCSLEIKGSFKLRGSNDEVVLRLEECEIEDPMPMGILANFHCLTHLHISGGSYVNEQMTFRASSFPRLKFLRLFDLEKLRKLRVEQGAMPLLSELNISKCSKLREWRVEQGAMPLLSKLSIYDCPHLQKVPDEVRSISAKDKLHIIKTNLRDCRR